MPPKDKNGRYIPLGSCEIDLSAIRVLVDKPKLTIDHVIFHAPATIVYWSDGTKTVVKCQECDERICKHALLSDGTCQMDISGSWKHDGLMHAMLKKNFPGYLDELAKWA